MKNECILPEGRIGITQVMLKMCFKEHGKKWFTYRLEAYFLK